MKTPPKLEGQKLTLVKFLISIPLGGALFNHHRMYPQTTIQKDMSWYEAAELPS